MGWFSDALFGKRKRIDQSKVNDYMQPYTKMIDEQEDISRQMMDPMSRLNQQRQGMLRQNTFDMLGYQQQDLASTGAMNNMTPAQIMMQQRSMGNQARGQFGQQMQGMLGEQYSQGLMGLQNVMQMRQGEGERLSNAHIQQVNAANARRQANMGMGMGLLGMGAQLGIAKMAPPDVGPTFINNLTPPGQ